MSIKTNDAMSAKDPFYGNRYELPSVQAVYKAIKEYEGSALVIYFTKRTTGETRRMLALYNAERADAATFGFDVVDKSLLAVQDLERGAPRLVPLDAVTKVVASGETVYPSTPRKTLAELEDEFEELFEY